MTTVLKKGDIILDYSGLRLNSSQMATAWASGVRAIARYSAGAASNPSHPSHDDSKWKLISPGEFSTLVNFGFDIFPNDEWYDDRITEGHNAGAQDGKAASELWRECGLARGSSLYISLDTHFSPDDYDDVEDFLGAYGDAMAHFYAPDMYGGTPILREMIKRRMIQYGWRPNAGSWSNDGLPYQPSKEQIKDILGKATFPSPAHLWQNGNYWFGKNADENVVINPQLGTHLQARAAGGAKPPANPPVTKPKPPIAKPKPVPTSGSYTIRPSDVDGLIAVCKRHGVTDWKAVAQLNHIAGPNYVIHTGDVIRWPGNKTSPGKTTDPKTPKPVKKVTHTVVSGDTLTGIANSWGCSLAALEKANPRAGHPAGHFDNIQPGDVIVHP